MYLTFHDHFRVWKQIDWEVTSRLHEKGLICDLVGKTKFVALTEEGLKKNKKNYLKFFL
jgi:hypothetical protein